MDFVEKNKKYDKHERTAFYNNVDIIIQDLSSVATKTDDYEFFNYEQRSLQDIKRECVKLVGEKIN
jgi:hypothetical protein